MKFFPEHIDTRLCDYALFSFAKMIGNQLAPYEWNDESEDWMVGMLVQNVSLVPNFDRDCI